MLLSAAINQFIETIQGSPKTIQHYSGILDHFRSEIEQEMILRSETEALTYNSIMRWIEARYLSEKSAYTIYAKILVVRRFLIFCLDRGIITDPQLLGENLSELMRLPRLPKKPRYGISDLTARKILSRAERGIWKKNGRRDLAIIRFLECTGCRRGGLSNLRIRDLNLEDPDPRIQRRATVREKGDKTRVVIMTSQALDDLRAYLRVRPKTDPEFDFVFVGNHRGEIKRLSPEAISGVLSRAAKMAGISESISPHRWRHRFARKLLKNRMPISMVSQLLGHESVLITDRYYGQFDIDNLQEKFDQIMEGDRGNG